MADLRCCVCDEPLFEPAECERGYCEDCLEGNGDLEDLLDAVLDADEAQRRKERAP